MTLVLVILFAFIGGALGEFEGLLGGAAIGILLARVRSLTHRAAALERRLAALEAARAASPAPAQAASEPLPAPASGITAETALADAAPMVMPIPDDATAERAAPADPWDDADASPISPSGVAAPLSPSGIAAPASIPPTAAELALTAISKRAVAFFTTGNVVAKVGIVILFFGVAFLIRLASERGLLPIEFRLAAVTAGAIALVAVGWKLRSRRRDYALATQGGGVGVLYLTIFAAARLYQLLPMSLAFALMVVLVVASAALAVLQNAPALAALGVSGGFLAPILTSTGEGSHVALFSYYALLNAGVLGIAWFRAWRVLNVLGFVFTYAIGSLWGARYYQPAHFASVEPFLVLSFLFYLAIPVLYALRQAPRLRGLVDGSLVFGNPIVFFTLQSRLVADIEFGRAYSALALATLYALLVRALWRRDPRHLRMLSETFIALATLFATVSIPFALDGHWTAAAWALEGAGVVWVGLRQARPLAQFAGLALQIGAAGMFIVNAPLPVGPAAAFDTTVLGAAMIALAALFTAYRFARDRDNAHVALRSVEVMLLAWGIAWWLGAVVYEINHRLAPQDAWAAVVAAIAVSGLALAWLAARLEWACGRLPPAGVLPLATLVIVARFLSDVHLAPWAYGGWCAWPLLVATSYVLLRHYAQAWPARVVTALHAGSLNLVVFLLTWLAAHASAQVTLLAGAWVLASCGAVSVAVLLTLDATRGSARWPLAAYPGAYRHGGAAPLIVLLGIWLLANFAYGGGPAPLPYLPLLNPLDLVACAALLAALGWWRGLVRDAVDLHGASRGFAMVFALAAFVVLNTVVLRSMHHYEDIPYRALSLWRAPAVQAALSLTWAALGSATMAYAARRAVRREIWMIGAALLGLVVAKLFLVDLAGSGAVARIVSFLGVGMVCLVIGYFAPIPPRRETPEAAA